MGSQRELKGGAREMALLSCEGHLSDRVEDLGLRESG